MVRTKVFRSIGVFLLMAMMLATVAFASSGLDAHCVVPANNGSAYGKQSGTKEVPGASAYIYNVTVGGGQLDDPNKLGGAWTRDLSTMNNAAYLAGQPRMLKGNKIKVEFSSNFLTMVATEVNGTWDTN